MANLFQYLVSQLYPKRSQTAQVQRTPRDETVQREPAASPRERSSDSGPKSAGWQKTEEPVRGQDEERIQATVEKEDFLLSQIDEFREKARQLQELLASKESKVAELQSLVSEREDKAQELDQILTERQEEAGRIVTAFCRRVDELSERVTTKMTDIERSISTQVVQLKSANEEQLASNRKLSEEQAATGRKLSEEQLAANKRFLEEQLAANRQFLEEQAVANKRLSEGQVAEVRELLENATAQLESIKTDLSEKVHSENVKCYRNIQDLFNEFDSKIEKMDEMERGMDSVKGYVKCISWFSILNFVLLAGFILYSLGVFHF